MNNSYEMIENLRKSAGTLPSEKPERQTKYIHMKNSIEVTLEDHSANPYKTMFVTSTATWGNNDYESKWPTTSPEGKLEVIKAVLTANTLPQAREMVQFVFRVKGTPRWLFDRHTQIPFTSFMSIGCRDNNKIDTDFVFEDEKMITNADIELYESLKDIYEDMLEDGSGSWQSARAFLPQNYQHSYHFGQNLLSISSMIFNETYEKGCLLMIYKELACELRRKFPLIELSLFNIAGQKKEDVYDKISNLKFEELSSTDRALFERVD